MTPESPQSAHSEGDAEARRGGTSYKIFLSSPGDVEDEREAATRVVERVNGELEHSQRLELIRWEDDYYTAVSTFQDQIVRPSQCDLVVCIFWKRLGSDLPEKYRRPDGTLPTGSEYEFEDAVQHAVESSMKVPDVLVYRKTAPVLFAEVTLELEKAQRERFLGFWRRWFHNEKGQFVAGFHTFEGSSEFEEMFETHLRKWLSDRAGEVVWTEGCPFRGLAPFDVEHAAVFFGRRRESERLRARFLANALAGVHFLLIVGPSGSGKSSLVRAGLIPRLATIGHLEGLPPVMRRALVSPAGLTKAAQDKWALGFSQALFDEGALGAELAEGDFNTPEQLAVLFASGGTQTATPIRRALERASSSVHNPTGLILVVDQLEEMFLWPRPSADLFLACLAQLGRAPVYVIATMRSEFRPQLTDLPQLADLAGLHEVRGPGRPESILEIEAPGAADIRDMISGPAHAAGLTFEGPSGKLPDLLTRIERDSSAQTLPALEYLLSQLYDKRTGKMLTHAAYDALGGVTGVLTSRGEAVLAAFGQAGEAAFTNLVRSLVTTTAHDVPPVARRLPMNLFSPDGAEGRLAFSLRDAGLLVSDQDTFRLAHESLITHWRRLEAVIANEQRLFDARERVLSAYRRYLSVPETDRAQRRRLLLRGLALEEARDLLTQWGDALLGDPLRGLPDFIRMSDQMDRRRRVWQLVGAAAVSAVFAAVVLLAVWFRSESLQEARTAEVRLDLARAQAALSAGDWDRALDIAILAHDLADTPETRSMALTSLIEQPPELATRLFGPATAARFGPDGTLITLAPAGLVNFLGNGSRRAVKLTPSGVPDVSYFDFAALPDGGLVILMSDGRIGLVSAQDIQGNSNGTLQPVWLAGPSYVLALPAQADVAVGEGFVRVAMGDLGTHPGRLVSCSLKVISQCQTTDLPPGLRSVAFSPSGDELAIASDHEVKVVDTNAPHPDGMPALQERDDVTIRSLGWSATGGLIVGSQQGEIVSVPRLNGAFDGASRKQLTSRAVTVLKGAPVAGLVASSCDTGSLCLLNLDDQGSVSAKTVLFHVPSDVVRLSWSVNGRQLVSIHADGQLRIWDTTPQHPVMGRFPGVDAPLTSVAAHQDWVAAGDAKGRVWAWRSSAASMPPQLLASGSSPVVNLIASASGVLAVALQSGELARIPAERPNGAKWIASDQDIERVGWLPDGKTLAATAPTEVLLLDQSNELSRHKVGGRKPEQTIGGLVGFPGRAGLILSVSDGTLLEWQPAGTRPPEPAVPPDDSRDTLSALSLAVDPSGRWLAASRADDQLRIYDLSGRSRPLILPLAAAGTKTVAFSPSGAMLAALTSDDQLAVWRFDASRGNADLLVAIAAVPTTFRIKNIDTDLRQARWIDWVDDTRLGIATSAGAVLILSFDQGHWADRLVALRRGNFHPPTTR